METISGGSKGAAKSEPVVYCVVPPRLAAIQPRLCEHFAGYADVEVVVDQRAGERRSEAGDELAGRLTPGLERRTPEGRRTAVPVARPGVLPPELRRYEQDLTFLAVPNTGVPTGEEDWRRRCLAAEERALDLARALIAASDALRSRGGLSPRRFRELARAEHAIERYNQWWAANEQRRMS